MNQRKPILYSAGALILFFLLGPFLPASAEAAAKKAIVLENSERHNLVGFLPSERRPSYDLKTVDGADQVILALMTGEAELGFINVKDYFLALSKGLPIVAVANPFQISPVGFAYRKNVFRRSFDDFRSETVLYEPGSTGEILFRSFLRRINITPNEMKWIPMTPEREGKGMGGAEKNRKTFERGSIVILENISEILHFSKNPETGGILFPHEFGIRAKGPFMIALRERAKKRPEETRAAVKEALDIFRQNLFDTRNIYTVLLRKTIPYVFQPDTAFGRMQGVEQNEMQRLLLEEGVLERPISEDRVFWDVLAEEKARLRPRTTVALSGPVSPLYAGFYTAEDNGYYEKDNLQVRLLHLSDDREVIAAVRSGAALIGAVSPVRLLQAEAEQPGLKVIGTLYQENPEELVSWMGSGPKPREILASKDLRVDEGGYGVLLQAEDSDSLRADREQVELRYSSLFALIDKRARIVTGIPNFSDPRLDLFRQSFEILPRRGTPLVGLSLFTTAEKYETERKMIRTLLKDTYHGYETSIFQSDRAAWAVQKRDGTLSLRNLRSFLKTSQLYLKAQRSVLGSVRAEKWRELAGLMTAHKALAGGVAVEPMMPEEARQT